jgi:chromosome segregation ATPase
MAFQRPHPRQRRTCKEHKAELEEENNHFHSELQAEVNSNRQNEKQIRKLERECVRCEQEIQTLNGEIEHLENALKEEITELKSKISSLKKQLYQAKKDICNNEKHISSIESQLVVSEKQVKKLRCRIKNISSRKNSPERENSPDLYNSDDNIATIAELVDAIDGFVDNRATVRDILIGQIKGAIRQICIKNNNLQRDLKEVRRARTQLQTDLGQEQRRRYDVEAEHDNEII